MQKLKSPGNTAAPLNNDISGNRGPGGGRRPMKAKVTPSDSKQISRTVALDFAIRMMADGNATKHLARSNSIGGVMNRTSRHGQFDLDAWPSACAFALLFLLALAVVLPMQAQTSAQNTVHYRATMDNVKYVYGVAPPVAHLHPGDVLEANSLDAFGNAIRKPGDTLALVKGDIPLHPFLGCIGVAPANGEARSSVVPAEFGGNMDAPEASVGNTLYLPVSVAGALLYFGDGHGAMGDGEIAGTAIEVPLRVRLQVELRKRQTIGWPRFENDHELMAAGIYRPLDDALRIAFSELVHWIHADYGLSELDSYELLSKVAHIHLTEMVDPNYVVIAAIDKKYLGKKYLPERPAHARGPNAGAQDQR
jgi:hypothetical protein